MSTWKELCHRREHETNPGYIVIDNWDFDKIRAVVEAAKAVDIYCSYVGGWDAQQLAFGDDLAKALNALGVTNEAE